MRKVMGLTSQAKGYVEWNLERLASIQISHGYSTQQVNGFHLPQLLYRLLQLLDFALQGVDLFSSGCHLLLHVHGCLEA